MEDYQFDIDAGTVLYIEGLLAQEEMAQAEAGMQQFLNFAGIEATPEQVRQALAAIKPEAGSDEAKAVLTIRNLNQRDQVTGLTDLEAEALEDQLELAELMLMQRMQALLG